MIEIGQRIRCREKLWEVLDVRGATGKELIRVQALGMERKLELTFVNPVDHIEILPPGEIKWHLAAPSQWQHLQNAFLWSMNHGEGCLVSLSRGRIALEDYQLEPALKALGLPRQRILIADDVGLGKTIEAGMLILELIARGRGNRILIIVPASLQDQWADEMADKFGLDFVVYDSNMIREVRSTLTRTRNPWELNHRVITSIDFVKQDRIRQSLKFVRWDVVLVDEAHYLAESSAGSKVTRTDRSRFGEFIADVTRAENLILMTATPHNGDPRGFYSLVRLLDPYVSPTERKIDRNRIERFLVRRTKRQINQLYGKRKFAERKPPQLIHVCFNDAERELYSAVCEYTDRNWRRARRTPGREAVGFAMMILKKRMLSSLHALRNSLKHRHDNLSEEIIDLKAKRGLVRDYKAGLPLREDQIQRVEEELLTCPVEKDLNAIRRDRKHLEGLLQKAEKLDPIKDSKAVALAKKLEEIFRQNPSEKVIVFTEYRDTQAFLEDFLTHPDRGYEGKIVLMHGGMDRNSRKEAEKIFSRPETRILLATDAASEGLNFQQRCHIVIHYELPWNPNRLEQRNGRVDRWGQEKDVKVFNLYIDEDECLEADILELLVKKLERIRRDLGSVADVTGVASGLDVHEDMMLVGGKRKRSEEGKRLLSELDRKYENLLDQRKRRLTFWRESQEDASLPRKNLAEVYDARDRTESVVPGPESLEEFVKDRITMAGGSVIPASEGEFAIVVPQVFQRPSVKARYDRTTFDRGKALADIERRIEFLTPAHPLVDAIIRHVRSSLYDPRAMNRMAYKTVKMDIDPGVLFTFLARFHDGVGRVIQEHVEPLFVSLGGAPSLNPELDRKILKAPFGDDLAEDMLRSMFEDVLVTLRNMASHALSERLESRRADLEKILARRRDEEIKRLERWASESEEHIRAELDTQPEQMQLFYNEDEELEREELQRERERQRKRLRRDLQLLEARVRDERERIEGRAYVKLAGKPELIGILLVVPEDQNRVAGTG